MPSVSITREPTHLVVSGNTFGIKETIKTLGGQWDPARRVWTLPLHLDTDETRARLGVPSKLEEEDMDVINERRRTTAAKRQERRRATAAAAHAALVKRCLADTSGKYSWVCCEHCEIVDFWKGHTSCRVHAHWDGQSWCYFRIFGSLYTGN